MLKIKVKLPTSDDIAHGNRCFGATCGLHFQCGSDTNYNPIKKGNFGVSEYTKHIEYSRKLPINVSLSVRPSAFISAALIGRIFVKFDIGGTSMKNLL